nr:transposase [Alkalibacillus haloalkaliphilus]
MSATIFNHAGLTPNQVIRLMDHQTINTRKVLPRAISIDEFKGDANGERFQTVIVDVDNHTIIDILPDRKIETIKSYLRTCDTSQVEML